MLILKAVNSHKAALFFLRITGICQTPLSLSFSLQFYAGLFTPSHFHTFYIFFFCGLKIEKSKGKRKATIGETKRKGNHGKEVFKAYKHYKQPRHDQQRKRDTPKDVSQMKSTKAC